MSKILIHCGSGNTDRPGRWSTINSIFTGLGESLITLGHDVHMMVHGAAQHQCNSNSRITYNVSDVVDENYIKNYNPDFCFTWNGVSDGDKKFVNIVGREKMIFGELGFFDHYHQTCYFDRCGVNARFGLMGEEHEFSGSLSHDEEDIISMLQKKYRRPRLVEDPYVFVPLQDETDTQITQLSPFKSMDEFLHIVLDLFRFDDRKILYKLHPRAPAKITLKHPKLVQVTQDVHHYIPCADFVFGINSTVLVETLLYHERIISYGAGIAARHFGDSASRKHFVATMFSRQMKWNDLKNPDFVRHSYLYEYLQ